LPDFYETQKLQLIRFNPVNPVDFSVSVDWMEKVSDQQYRKRG